MQFTKEVTPKQIRGIRGLLQSALPETVFSEQVYENLQDCTARLVLELAKLSRATSQSAGKSLVDTQDLQTAFAKLDFEALSQSIGTPIEVPEREGSSLPTNSSTPPQQRTSNTKINLSSFKSNYRDPEADDHKQQKCLYQQNNGHSDEVQEFLKQNGQNVMMVACLGSAVVFKRVVESIRESCSQPEINFFCGPTGIQVQAVGPNHVSLLALELRATGFEMYMCPQTVVLGLSINGLSSFLKQVVKNDQITIIHVANSRECTLFVEDGSRSSVFSMKLKVMETQAFQITEGNYSSQWIMPSAALARVCRDIKSCANSDNVQIITTKDNKISFVGVGRYGKYKTTCDETMAKLVVMNNPCELLFSHPYLYSFTKAAPLSTNLILKLGEESPLMCGFEIENLGHLHFYLAPKIKDNSYQDFPEDEPKPYLTH